MRSTQTPKTVSQDRRAKLKGFAATLCRFPPVFCLRRVHIKSYHHTQRTLTSWIKMREQKYPPRSGPRVEFRAESNSQRCCSLMDEDRLHTNCSTPHQTVGVPSRHEWCLRRSAATKRSGGGAKRRVPRAVPDSKSGVEPCCLFLPQASCFLFPVHWAEERT